MPFKDADKKRANSLEYYNNVIKIKTGEDLKKHKESKRKISNAWKIKHKGKYKAWQRNWHIKNKYGITREQFDDLLRKQGFACAVCGNGSPGGKFDWHIDHDHSTGKIRGLLCHGCNTGLGGFKDNAKVMKAAIKYLRGGGIAI